MLHQNNEKELDKLMGLNKLLLRTGTSIEVSAAGPEPAMRVLALALGLSEKWV
jgi:phosphotransferase system HPr-like phosphotransfer protein